MRLVNVVILAICAILIVGCSTLSPEKKEGDRSGDILMEKEVTLRNARICDTSGCYFAWNVVDSDSDGVSDADELMAGTNPYDPLSRPSLVVVAELGGKQQLPSFEAGLGAFIVFPAELQAMVQESKNDPLAAFPLTGEREDTLSRLGISTELLKQHNIDMTRDGFTVGPLSKTTDSGVPERRVGGVELRLISEDKDEHCCYPLLPIEPNAPKTDAGNGGTRTDYSDGSHVVDFPDGSGWYVDKDGEIIVDWYVNPDADPGADAPTPEQEAAFVRLRGATILTLENWSAPALSGVEPRDPRTTIILVDPEYAYETAIVFDVPTLTDAQPEVRPDLPNPGVPADPKNIPANPNDHNP